VPAVAGRQHQHGHDEPGAAPSGEQRQAIHAGQPEIEEHRVVAFAARQIVGARAVARHVDGVTGGTQGLGQMAGQARLVFDDQESHRCSGPCPYSASAAEANAEPQAEASVWREGRRGRDPFRRGSAPRH
jgi:hypothetical protein